MDWSETNSIRLNESRQREVDTKHFNRRVVENKMASPDPPTTRFSSFNSWRELSYRPFLILLAIAGSARVALMLAYFPAIMIFVDSPRYARINSWPLFGDFWMPAGYPMLLQLLHAISNRLWVTIAFQHLLGVSIGAFLFLALRRLGIARWIACLPAAVPLLSGDQLYQEHTVMSDFFFTVLATAGVCVAIRGLIPIFNSNGLRREAFLLERPV